MLYLLLKPLFTILLEERLQYSDVKFVHFFQSSTQSLRNVVINESLVVNHE